jgi:ParB/RepB/Spo0J family partition protein
MTKLDLVFQRVEIKKIEHKDRTFSMRSNASSSPVLVKSICRHGVLAPLTLQSTGEDGYRIVCGFRRYRVARDLAIREIPARIVGDINPRELFEMAIGENMWGETLSDFEKGTVVAKLCKHFGVSQEEIVRDYLGLLGIRQDRFHCSRYLAIARLPEELRDRLDLISINIALALARWPSKERFVYMQVLECFRTTRSQQRELLQVLDDLRERSSRELGHEWNLEKLWKSSGCADLVESQKSNSSLLVEEILTRLQKLNRPELEAMRKNYQREVAGLKVPSGVNFHPPNFFEGDKIDVRFSMTGSAQLESIARELLRISRQPGLRSIFELL